MDGGRNEFRKPTIRPWAIRSIDRSAVASVVASLPEIGAAIPPSFTPSMAVDDQVDNWLTRFLFRLQVLSGHIGMWTPTAMLRYAVALRNGVGS